MPFLVCASTGSTRPRVVVNRTTVPFCTGVPPDSATNALTSVAAAGRQDQGRRTSR